MQHEVRNILDRLSPELKLVLSCLKWNVSEKAQDNINVLVNGYIDWNLFVHLTIRHRVYPLVYRYLSILGHPLVPCEVVHILRQKSLENTSNTLLMTGELVKLQREIEKREIPGVVLKGFPLALVIYGNVALRPSHDLDILIWPEDVVKARKIIEMLGYEIIVPSFSLTPQRLRNWMIAEHHIKFWHKDKKICVELHWKLGHHSGVSIPLAKIENNLTRVNIAGQPISILGLEELILYLSLHGAGHAWSQLRWLCDLGVLLRRGGFSWERLYGLAEHLGIKTLLDQAVILAHNLLKVPIPDNVGYIVMKDKKAQDLVGMALPYITATQFGFTPFCFYEKKYQLSIQSGWGRKFAYICGRFSPAEADIKLISLPDYLYFMYYFLRPFTWFGHQVCKLAGNIVLALAQINFSKGHRIVRKTPD